ncbi:UvrD-helicase domain-containing protein, partial [Tahibacter caeni]|uniref:UvrD-helicase domain-containing protein n=1 Tax=Tahibacter caeni TaxID=1453545 RepID=UPI0021486E04
VRAPAGDPDESAAAWARAVEAARAIAATPERFRYPGPKPTSQLLQALRALVAAADAAALDGFDVDDVCAHAAKLESQFRRGQLDDALNASLAALFADLQRCAGARANSKAAALERYRQRLLARRREQLLRESRQTFNTLLENAAAALSDRSGPLAARLRAQWPVALVDEFQDTDALQYRILDAIYRDTDGAACGRLVMIGDPKQAIYRFRGGDIHTYLAAAATADEVLTLDTNRRSSAAYVAALNELYATAGPRLSMQPDHPIRYEAVRAAGRREPYLDADGEAFARPLQLHYCGADPLNLDRRREQALEACARHVVALLRSGARIGESPLQPGDIAVLVPKNQQVERLRELLLRQGVPCVGAGKRSVFDTELARELQLLLYAVEHAHDDAAVRAALATRFGGLTLARIAALREDADAWQQQRRRFVELRREWQRHGVLGVVLAQSADLALRLPQSSERERALTDLRHLGELLQAQSERLAGAEQLLAWFAQQRESPDAGEADDWQLRLESDARRVRLLTLHASKGLEFPLVLLPLMWDHTGREPGLVLAYDEATRLRVAELAEGRAAALARVREEDQDERFRVLYVALTRAQYACHVYALPPLRPRDGKKGAPEAADPERSALDALLARLQAATTGVALAQQAPHLAWQADDWAWPEQDYRAAAANALDHLAARREPAWPVLEHTYSFTALVAGRGRGEQEESAADDERAARDEALAPLPLAAVAAAPDPRLLALANWRGPEFGNAVHAVFERRDPHTAVAAQTRLIEHSLRDYAVRVVPAQTAAAVIGIGALVQRTVELPLFDGTSLQEVAATRQRAEMGFQFVLDAVSLRALRDACARHGAADLLPRDLQGSTLTGLMSGKIDLIVEHAGRFHVLDYKTNYLGDTLADYAPVRLEQAMAEHHYGFQALLYTVALERYLRQRLSGYRRERHLGEAIYLFVRACGLAPELGVWRRRFDAALLDAVDAALGGAA